VARAVLESIAYQTRDLVEIVNKESGVPLEVLRVDGGASNNDLLMQFQADILGIQVDRPKMVETTAAGAAMLAGLGSGFWKSADDLKEARKVDELYTPKMSAEERKRLYDGWKEAVRRVSSTT
jgi:glycerol kinase